MNTSSLRGAMIGAGFFAEFQAEAWQRLSDVEIVAVADPLIERARALSTRFGNSRVYARAEEMLAQERLDFVDIATRPDTHRALVELAATQQVSVICQKPMAESWSDCVGMVEFCRAANARLLVHENWHWQPWYREIKRLLDDNVLGQIFHLGFCMRNGDGRGTEPYAVQPYFRTMPRLLIYETLVHFLDAFRFLGGEFELTEYSVGAGEYVRSGDPLPPATFTALKQHDAILLGAMGLPDVRWPNGVEMTPQIDLREKLDLYCGLRPVRLYHMQDTPLKKYGAGEIDLLLVRESTEGLFAAQHNKISLEALEATDTMRITRHTSERLFRAAFREAEQRRGLVSLIIVIWSARATAAARFRPRMLSKLQTFYCCTATA